MTVAKVSACSLAVICLFLGNCLSYGRPADQEKFQSIPLAHGENVSSKILVRDGVPFITGTLPFSNGSAQVDIGVPARRIFLLGMVEDASIHCWMDPTNHSVRFYVGDNLGQIRLNYADGSTET